MTDEEKKAVVRKAIEQAIVHHADRKLASLATSQKDLPELNALLMTAVPSVTWPEKTTKTPPINPNASLCHECKKELGDICTLNGGNRFCSATCVQLDMSRTLTTNLNEESKRLRAQLSGEKKITAIQSRVVKEIVIDNKQLKRTVVDATLALLKGSSDECLNALRRRIAEDPDMVTDYADRTGIRLDENSGSVPEMTTTAIPEPSPEVGSPCCKSGRNERCDHPCTQCGQSEVIA